MVYTLRFFFSLKCSLFHNYYLFGSYVIHILYTGCAKIKKKIIPAPKGYAYFPIRYSVTMTPFEAVMSEEPKALLTRTTSNSQFDISVTSGSSICSCPADGTVVGCVF